MPLCSALISLFPDTKPWLTITGAFGLLVLQLPSLYAGAIRQLPSVMGFFLLRLPYVRFAFPQVIVPVVLAYWGLQVRALKSGSKRDLTGMALLQFAVCAAFPYILPVVALGTTITILIAKCRDREIALSWPAAFVFAVICGVLDIGYLVLAGLGKSHGNVQFALQFRPEIILPALRTYVLLLVVASGLAMVSRASLAARATVAGLALSNALFAFSDVFFPPSTMMLNHVNYIIALTTWLPLLVFVWALLERFDGRVLRTALISVLALIGFWEGFANYRLSISVNLLQAAAVDELEKLVLTAKDLVVAPAQASDDISCWVPLISPARVVFTRDAENILSADRIRGEQALRQALYLEMGGINHASFLSLTDLSLPDLSTPLFNLGSIMLFGEIGYFISPLALDHLRGASIMRERLGPVLARLDADPASANSLFVGYERVIIIDSSRDPFFDQSAFSTWLEIEKAYERNGTKVWICRPRPAR